MNESSGRFFGVVMVFEIKIHPLTCATTLLVAGLMAFCIAWRASLDHQWKLDYNASERDRWEAQLKRAQVIYPAQLAYPVDQVPMPPAP